MPGHPENQDQVLQVSEDLQALQLIPEREQRDEGGSWGQGDGANSASAHDRYSTVQKKPHIQLHNNLWYFYYHLFKKKGSEGSKYNVPSYFYESGVSHVNWLKKVLSE